MGSHGRDGRFYICEPPRGTHSRLIEATAANISAETILLHNESRPGKFLCLSVTDTGCGIPENIMLRIFEPFFTTKPVGKGTGLGLATVYGVAKRHKGWVEVKSKVGEGTTFKIFIPASEKVREKSPGAKISPEVRRDSTGGHETILVVEDEDALRELVVEVLKPNGYNVLSANCGAAALEQWAAYGKKIHLLITDMVMPGGIMGRELAERLMNEDSKLRVIYTSGYSPGMAGKDMVLFEGQNFLGKPYPPSRLLQAVREFLDK